jgi:WD40 repeat protein
MICISKPVTEKHVGYRNPKLKSVLVPVCKVEKRMRMETKTVAETVNKTEEVSVPVKTLQNGKEVTTYKTETRTVPYQVTKMVSFPVEYTVNVTKMVPLMMTDTDPVVRVWTLDGVLQTKIVEASPVTALAWRDDGVILATACDRNDPCTSTNDCNSCGMPTGDRADVRFWDPATGRLLFALPCSTQQVTIVAFSPDRKHIAAAGGMGITLWSTESRHLLANQRGDGTITDLLFSPDNTFLSAHSKCNQTTRLWDVPASRQTARLPGTGPLMQFLPNSRFLTQQQQVNFGFGSQKDLGRWTAREGASEKHPGDQSSVWAYSADGRRFVSGRLTSGRDLAVFDGQTGARVCDLAGSNTLGFVQNLQVSRDGSRVAALAGNEAVLWDGASGKVLARKWNTGQADLSADGKFWAVATQPVASYDSGPKLMPAPSAPEPKQEPKKVPVAAAPAKTGEQIRLDAEDDPSFVAQQAERVPQPKPTTEGPKDVPPAPQVGPLPPKDGPAPKIAPAAPPQSTVTLFDSDGKEVAKLPADFTNSYSGLVFDPTSKFLIGVGDNTWVRIWNVATGKLIAQHKTNDPEVAISPDGRFLAFHSAQPMMAPAMPKAMPVPSKNLADAADLPLTFAAHVSDVPLIIATETIGFGGGPAYQPDQSPPGQPRPMWIAVVELATGKLIWQANVMGTSHGGMAFSADGKRLALGFADCKAGYVQLWDTASLPDGETFKFQAVARYAGHVGAVNAVAFSPDGKLLASGGDDQTVKIWKLPANGELGPGSDIPMGMPAVVAPPAPYAPVPTVNPPAPMEKIPSPPMTKSQVRGSQDL